MFTIAYLGILCVFRFTIASLKTAMSTIFVDMAVKVLKNPKEIKQEIVKTYAISRITVMKFFKVLNLSIKSNLSSRKIAAEVKKFVFKLMNIELNYLNNNCFIKHIKKNFFQTQKQQHKMCIKNKMFVKNPPHKPAQN